MASFKINQGTVGGVGVSRHDLVPNAVVTFVVDPIVAGSTYAWEILDKVGSVAALVGSGSSVTLTLGVDDQPCAFLVKLTETNGTTVTEDIRIASVRTLSAGLRIPLFREAASPSNSFAVHPGNSTDNATYSDLAGLGTPAQNWRGWAEWAREVVMAVEGAGGAASFVLRPGGVAAKNVYLTWAALYAAAALVEGPVLVQFDDTLGAITIPTGVYDVEGWSFIGRMNDLSTVTFLDGGNFVGGFRAENLRLNADVGIASSALTGVSRTYDFWNVGLTGTPTVGLIYSVGDFPASIHAHGESWFGECAIRSNANGCTLYLYDMAGTDTNSLLGDAENISVVMVSDRARISLTQTNWTAGSTISVIDPTTAFNGPINASQLGVTPLHVGSVYLTSGTWLLQVSSAMLGIIDVSGTMPTATLDLSRYSTAELITTWTATGALSEVQLAADAHILNSDWYDLYIYTSNALDTAVLKGLHLQAVRG